MRDKKKDQTLLERSQAMLFVGERYALLGGVLAAAIAVGGQILIGAIYSNYQAKQLLEAVIPSMLAVGSSVVTATATILALMLTLLSLAGDKSKKLGKIFFVRVKRISLMAVFALSGSLLMLLLISLPISETSQIQLFSYKHIYYFFIGILAGIVGLVIASVLMLFSAITTLVQLVGPEEFHG